MVWPHSVTGLGRLPPIANRHRRANAVEKVGAELFSEIFMGRTPNQDSRAACRSI
jgi:hypothetical protein